MSAPRQRGPRAGGAILADQLRVLGAEAVFCVPGESFLGLLDGLFDHRDAIRTISCRHEAGATNMAEAWGKLSGRPGIAAVTRGPGATNGANGVHTAFQDSTPMILFIGQVGADMLDREAFQEMDYRRVFGEMAKWVAEIRSPDRIPEYVARAWAVATSGRPGPVVLALPEDVLSAAADVDDCRPPAPALSGPTPEAMARVAEMIAAADAPLMVLGGGGWTAPAAVDAAAVAERLGLPVATSFRRQDRIDNDHPHFVGVLGIAPNPALIRRVKEETDLILAVGPRLGEMTTQGYSLLDIPSPRQTFIHVHPGPEELGAVHRPDLGVVSTSAAFLAAARALPERATDARVAAMRAEFEAFGDPASVPPPPGLNLAEAIHAMSRRLPKDAVVANGAGNYAVWVHRFHRHRAPGTQLAPTSGSMGYGVPAAIAAALRDPGRVAVAIAGDGCFMMLSQEMATAAQYGAKVVFVVVDNGMFGTIRMHQERTHPGRVIATALANPDFVGLARACGGDGETVTRTDAFRPALERALAADGCYLLHLVTDPEALTPVQTLSGARAQGEAAAGR